MKTGRLAKFKNKISFFENRKKRFVAVKKMTFLKKPDALNVFQLCKLDFFHDFLCGTCIAVDVLSCFCSGVCNKRRIRHKPIH